MPRPTRLLAICVALLASLAGCGGGSTSPEDDGPPAFSHMLGSIFDHETPPMGVAVMSDGTRMVCGEFEGALVVSGYPDTILAGGLPRNFLATFKPDGSVVKTSQIGGGAVGMRKMERDRDDNLLLVGSFGGTSTFANHTFTAVNGDMIFAKLQRSGVAEWVQVGAGTGVDAGSDITTSSDGNIYVTGVATGEITVAGEDVGQSGHKTGFVVKLNSDGGGIWQQTAGVSSATSACEAVAVSADGSVVVCGSYDSPTLDFAGDVLDHGSGTFDSFIGRFGADGTPLGSIHLQSAGAVAAHDVTTIGDDVVVTGVFTGNTDFDPPGAGGSIKVNGTANAFVARYTKSGEMRWAKSFGPGNNQSGLSIARLSDGHILVCGQFETTIKLGSKTLTSAGNPDAFIARLDGDGNVISAGSIGGPGEEFGIIATTDGSTAIIVGGTGSDVCTFPDGKHRNRIGSFDGYIFQQP